MVFLFLFFLLISQKACNGRVKMCHIMHLYSIIIAGVFLMNLLLAVKCSAGNDVIREVKVKEHVSLWSEVAALDYS